MRGMRETRGITHAQCPMPNTSLREAAPTTSLRDATRTLSTSAPCPMPNAQSTFVQEYSMPLASILERDNQ